MKTQNKLGLFIGLMLAFFSIGAFADMKQTYINTPLSTLVEPVSKYTQKNITFSQDAGEVLVSLLMPKEKTPDKVYLLFKESLRVAGLKIVEKDGLLSILPTNRPSTSDTGDGLSYRSTVVTLKHAKASSVSDALQKTVSYGGYISPAGDDKLVINDYSDQLPQILSLVRKLDKPSVIPKVTKSISLSNIKPSEIQPIEGINLTAYDSVNRLLVTGRPDEVEFFLELIQSMDQSRKTIHARLIVTSMSRTFADEFNLVALFQKGALSTNLKSISYNNLVGFTDGISAVLSIFKEHSEVTVLSQPFIQLIENKKGSFNVGREIPVLVSQVDKESGQTINNIERKQIGLKVELTANVRPDGKVEVDLSQNLSGLSETQIDNSKDLITDDQNLKTTLLIEPDKVYSVGGVIDRRNVLKRSELPIFSLFDSDTENEQSQQIVIFIEVTMGV